MKNYYRVMLGSRSVHATLGREQGFIGADYQINQDLSADLTDNWRDRSTAQFFWQVIRTRR
jgi:restriction system protein